MSKIKKAEGHISPATFLIAHVNWKERTFLIVHFIFSSTDL